MRHLHVDANGLEISLNRGVPRGEIVGHHFGAEAVGIAGLGEQRLRLGGVVFIFDRGLGIAPELGRIAGRVDHFGVALHQLLGERRPIDGVQDRLTHLDGEFETAGDHRQIAEPAAVQAGKISAGEIRKRRVGHAGHSAAVKRRSAILYGLAVADGGRGVASEDPCGGGQGRDPARR